MAVKSSSVDTFLKGLISAPSLRDYQHASKVFTPGTFALVPKSVFNFYVYFDYTVMTEGLQTPKRKSEMIGALCKSAQLPKFTVEHKTMNAYNRVDVVQSKMKYEPVTLKFHDDSSDIVREFWYDYYSFYYRDSDYDEAIYSMNSKYLDRQKDRWGYGTRNESNGINLGFDDGSAEGFQTQTDYHPLKAIRIFSIHRKNFSEYVLINPYITNFSHGEHQMEGSNLMDCSMTVTYQAVKYRKGNISDKEFPSSYLLLYDQTTSPLLQGGTGASIFGVGGVVSTVGTIANDLANGNLLGAAAASYRMRQTISQAGGINNLVRNEAQSAVSAAASGNPNPFTPWTAPSPSDTKTVTANGVETSPAQQSATASANTNGQPPVIEAPPPNQPPNQAVESSGSSVATPPRTAPAPVVVPPAVAPVSPPNPVQGIPLAPSAPVRQDISLVVISQSSSGGVNLNQSSGATQVNNSTGRPSNSLLNNQA